MKLYKFTKLEYGLDIIKNNRLYLNIPEEFNDPFDCDLKTDESASREASNLIVNYFDFKDLYLLFSSGQTLDLFELGFVKKVLEKGKLFKTTLALYPRYVRQQFIDDYIRTHKTPRNVAALEERRSNYFFTIKKTMEDIRTRTLIYCFSTRKDSILMWSHYANQHNGYCLVFKSLNGFLYQAKKSMRESINIGRNFCDKVHVSEHIGPKFKFCDVIYGETSALIDPFLYFPQYVSKCKIANEQERLDFFEKLERHHLEKGACWEYEQESRLLLPNPMSWITGEKIEYTKHQRLFYYDFSQLVGVVFGSRMSQENRNRIKEIIDEKIESRLTAASSEDRRFKFVYFQTKLSSKERKLELEPLEINSLSTHVKKTDATFDREYEEWKKGWCLEFSGPGSARKTYVV